jgi:hypothetical protein
MVTCGKYIRIWKKHHSVLYRKEAREKEEKTNAMFYQPDQP